MRISHCIIVAFLCFAANVAKAQIVTANPLEWAARMNAIKAAAEETILLEFLYPEENR